MHLSPHEQERLLLSYAAELARRRRAKGWRLNHPEALALICDEMHEAARGGATYDEVVATAAGVLTEDDVIEGVADLVPIVRIECLFGDGSRIVAVDRPIGPARAPAAGAGA